MKISLLTLAFLLSSCTGSDFVGNSKEKLAGENDLTLDQVNWTPYFDTVFDSSLSGGAYVITPAALNKKGFVATKNKYRIEKFTLSFSFIMDEGGHPGITSSIGPVGADGISIGFTDANVPSAQISSGGHLGFIGLGGYAISLDTFKNNADNGFPGFSDPSGNFIGMMKGSTDVRQAPQLLTSSDTEAAGVFFNDGIEHQVKVEFDSGKISVSVDNKTYIQNFMIPNFVPYEGYVVITGGTGAGFNRQVVRNLKVEGLK